MTKKRLALIAALSLLALSAGCAAPVEAGDEALGAYDNEPGYDYGLGNDLDYTPVGYETWDADADGLLDEDEFGAAFDEGAWFGEWDVDDDDRIDEDEFGDATFDAWDVNDDDLISEDEWREASDAYYDDVGAFDAWDANDDRLIDDDEFGDELERTGLFDTWDVDDNMGLDADEFGEGAYGLYDTDGDGAIDDEEYYGGGWM